MPFYHSGMARVMPEHGRLPRVGQTVAVTVGEPVDVSDLTCQCREGNTKVLFHHNHSADSGSQYTSAYDDCITLLPGRWKPRVLQFRDAQTAAQCIRRLARVGAASASQQVCVREGAVAEVLSQSG